MHMKKYMHMKQSRHCKQNGNRPGMAGFTLVEVLVALIIIAVGMLGLAKIQALAYASTGIAGSQSLAALQASSLVSAMRANRNYWSTVVTPFTLSFTVVNGTSTLVTVSDAALSSTSNNCIVGGNSPACTPAQLAAYDLNNTTNGWIKGLGAVLPNPSGTISCPTPAAGAQLGCSIQLTWVENTVSVNSQSQASALAAPTYTVFVVP
jgi:type IV pilus assembly protein PilV